MNVTPVNNLTGSDKNAQLREKAAEVVSNVFYGTLLKEFRQNSESGIFSGGFAGEAFQQQLDNIYIAEMSRQGRNPIVDSMVRQLSRSHTSGYNQVPAMEQVSTKNETMSQNNG